jgi:hypothetical protein
MTNSVSLSARGHAFTRKSLKSWKELQAGARRSGLKIILGATQFEAGGMRLTIAMDAEPDSHACEDEIFCVPFVWYATQTEFKLLESLVVDFEIGVGLNLIPRG